MRRRSGEFIDVPSFPGAVLVNVADLMQRWTGDHFVSVVSRREDAILVCTGLSHPNKKARMDCFENWCVMKKNCEQDV